MSAFHFAQKPVEKRSLEIWEGNCSGDVDRLVQRELRPFDEVENNGVLQTNEGVSNVAQVEGGFRIEEIEGHFSQCG